MSVKRHLFILGLLVLFAPPALAARPTVDVQVDRTSVSMDDELQVTVTGRGDFDRLTEPATPGFEIAGRSQSSQFQFGSGGTSKTKQIQLRLRPQAPGKHILGSATLISGGKPIVASTPVLIEVTKPKATPVVEASQAQDLSRRVGQDLFLTAESARTSYYVGEPFVLTWNLNFNPDVKVSSVEMVHVPKLEGMLAEEISSDGERSRIRKRTISGSQLNYVTRSIQLVTGLKPGRVVVDPMTIRVTTGNRWSRSARYTVKSEPYSFDLLALPTQGRPTAFREGNMGRLSLTASLRRGDGQEPTRAEVGERLILEAIVSGQGNLVGVKPPVITINPAFDVQVLPTKHDDELRQSASGVRGKRVFQYLLTPLEEGRLTTPAVEFAFFDTQAARYRSLSYPGTSIKVTAQNAHAAGASPIAGAVPQGEDIGPTLHGVSLGEGGDARWVGTLPFWLGLVLPLLGFLLVEGRARAQLHRQNNAGKHRERGAYGQGKKRLKLAEQALKEGLVSDFYDHINRTFTSYFEERLNVSARGMTHEVLRAALQSNGYGREMIDSLIVELENCDFARFAPAQDAEEDMRDALDRAQRLLRRFDGVTPEVKP